MYHIQIDKIPRLQALMQIIECCQKFAHYATWFFVVVYNPFYDSVFF